MNKFICLGAHNGDMVRVLDRLNTKEVLGVEQITWDEIHLFEPQPGHAGRLQALQQADNRVQYHPEAAYIEDKAMEFYIKGDLGHISSTLDKGKTTGALRAVVTVQAINFIKWLENNTAPEDFIFLDMDIECGEFYILPELIKSPIAERINFISIEWHDSKSTTWQSAGLKVIKDVNEYFGNRLLNHDRVFGDVLSH